MRMTSVFVALLFAAALGISTYALTASNIILKSNAGQGAGTITSFTVSATSYTLDSSSPQIITATRFTLNGSSPDSVQTVSAKLGSASYQSCSLSSTTASTSTWTCPVPSVSVVAAGSLQVAAAQ